MTSLYKCINIEKIACEYETMNRYLENMLPDFTYLAQS